MRQVSSVDMAQTITVRSPYDDSVIGEIPAQTAADVPFDVAAIRYIAYLSNRQGLTGLAADVTRRLETLRTRR